jgi:hypothetical protein
MTFEQINDMVGEIGLPYAYYQFAENEAPKLPYVIFYVPKTDNFGADNEMYYSIKNLDIELYTEQKSPFIEEMVEEVLKAHHIFFNKTESYLDSEEMFEVLYEMQV